MTKNISALVLNQHLPHAIKDLSSTVEELYPQREVMQPTKKGMWTIRTRQGNEQFGKDALPAGFCAVYAKNRPEALFCGADSITNAQETAKALTRILEPKKYLGLSIPKKLNNADSTDLGFELTVGAAAITCMAFIGVAFSYLRPISEGFQSQSLAAKYLFPNFEQVAEITSNYLHISRDDARGITFVMQGTGALCIQFLAVPRLTKYAGKIMDKRRNSRLPEYAQNYLYGHEAVPKIMADYITLQEQRLKQELCNLSLIVGRAQFSQTPESLRKA